MFKSCYTIIKGKHPNILPVLELPSSQAHPELPRPDARKEEDWGQGGLPQLGEARWSWKSAQSKWVVGKEEVAARMDWAFAPAPLCFLPCQGCPARAAWAEAPCWYWGMQPCAGRQRREWQWQYKSWGLSFWADSRKTGPLSCMGCRVAGALSVCNCSVWKGWIRPKEKWRYKKFCHCGKQGNSLSAKCIYFYL